MIDSKAKNKNCGVKVYNPHYCARQLDCVQSIPYPFLISSNKGLKKRAFFTEIDPIAKEMKIKKLKVVGDSNLVVRQTDGTFALKKISLAPTQSLVQKLCDEIDVELTHVNRSTNRHADSLATDASKIKFEDDEDEAVIKISKRRTPAHGTLTISYMKMLLKKEIGDML